MKITADTNMLVRLAVRDDKAQAKVAENAIKKATLIAVALPSFCEFAWVLDRLYHFERADIAQAIRALLTVESVVVNRPAVEAGLTFLEAGGDFADAVIAYEGDMLGCDTFASFNKKAVALLKKQGKATLLLAS